MLFLLRLNIGKKPEPAPSRRRVRSPSIGSILMTSAPMSASTMPQVGPMTMWVNSMTRRPCQGLRATRVVCSLIGDALLSHRLGQAGAPERAVQGFALQPRRHLRAQGHQRIEVLAGLDAHAGQHVGQVFGRHVAAGAGRMRAAADAAQAGVEAAHAQFAARHRHWPGPGRACRGSGRSSAGRRRRGSTARTALAPSPDRHSPRCRPGRRGRRRHRARPAPGARTSACSTRPWIVQPKAVLMPTSISVFEPAASRAARMRAISRDHLVGRLAQVGQAVRVAGRQAAAA